MMAAALRRMEAKMEAQEESLTRLHRILLRQEAARIEATAAPPPPV
jgi:hypothetical protein